MENNLYKELYLTMLHETEKAIHSLINAQQKCEELYIQAMEFDSVDKELSE